VRAALETDDDAFFGAGAEGKDVDFFEFKFTACCSEATSNKKTSTLSQIKIENIIL
jgi:hypothetical protein